MWPLGVSRVFMFTLCGFVAVTLLPQYTSSAAVLKNSCPPDDYLCNHIYQLKLETYGLIRELERRFPDLIDGEQDRDEGRSDISVSDVEDGNIQKLDEVSMEPNDLRNDISKVPLNYSSSGNTSTGATADPIDDSSSTFQAPSTTVSLANITPTDQQTASPPSSDRTEEKVETSPTQTDNNVDPVSTLPAGNVVATTSQRETTHSVTTLDGLSGQSTAGPVPRSSPAADGFVSKVAVAHGTSAKATTIVTDETLNHGTPSISSTKEEEMTSPVSKVSTIKPVPVTIGHVDINGGSRFITESSSIDSTDSKHKSSTQASPKSTGEAVNVEEKVSNKVTDSVSATASPHPNFRRRTETASSKSTHTRGGEVSSVENTSSLSSTNGETRAVTDLYYTTQHASTESPKTLTSYNEFTSGKAQRKTSPLILSTTTREEQDEESRTTVTEPVRKMEVSSIEPVPSTDSIDTLSHTTLSPVSLTKDESSTSTSKLGGASTTEMMTSRAALETEYVSGSGDTFLVVPTDTSESSTGRASSTPKQATTSVAKSASGPVSESAKFTTGSTRNRTVIEGKWTALYNTEISTTEIPYTEIVTEEMELTTFSDTSAVVNIRDATTRRVLESSSTAVTTQSSPAQSRQTTEVTPQPEDIASSVRQETTTFKKDVTRLGDESDEVFVTSIDYITEIDATSQKDVTYSKFFSTETIDETEIIDETFVTAEIDTTTRKDATTEKSIVTSQEPPTTTPAPPRDCDEIWRRGYRENDIYTIFPDADPNGFPVFCDLQDVDGGWTVIQRRVNGSINFYRSWFDYVLGFGSLRREFYLGNEKIHQLTSQKKYELSILMWDFEGESRYARYQLFRLGDFVSDYELSVRGYTGNAGNSLGYHSRGRFSTFDRDVDDNPAVNCALMYGSGWWFKDCNAKSNLNGHYLRGEHSQRGRGITWKKWKGLDYSLRYSEMRIKPNGL